MDSDAKPSPYHRANSLSLFSKLTRTFRAPSSRLPSGAKVGDHEAGPVSSFILHISGAKVGNHEAGPVSTFILNESEIPVETGTDPMYGFVTEHDFSRAENPPKRSGFTP